MNLEFHVVSLLVAFCGVAFIVCSLALEAEMDVYNMVPSAVCSSVFGFKLMRFMLEAGYSCTLSTEGSRFWILNSSKSSKNQV